MMVPTRPTETTTTRTGFGHNKLGDVHNVSVFQFCHLFNTECWKFSQKKKTNEEMMVALLFIFICVELEFWIYFYCGREVLKWMCVDMTGSEGWSFLSTYIFFFFLENVFHLDFRRKSVWHWCEPSQIKKSVLIKNSQPWTKKLSWTWRLVIWKVREGET